MDVSIADKNSPFSPDARNFRPGCREEILGRIQILAVGYHPQMANWSYPEIFSPFWRMYANIQPGSWLQVGPQRYELDSRHLLLVPSHLLFHCQSDRVTDHTWIHMELAPEWRSELSHPVSLEMTASRIQLLHQLQEEVTADDPFRLHLTAQALIGTCLSAMPMPDLLPETDGFREMVRRMEKTPGSIASVATAASEAGMGERQLRRMFQRQFHQSPREFLQGCRIRLAAQRLRHSADSLDHIAEECGYADRFHFSKAFRKAMGCPPALYRKGARPDPVTLSPDAVRRKPRIPPIPDATDVSSAASVPPKDLQVQP